MADQGIREEHFAILKKSGILNPDVTLEQIVTAAGELEKVGGLGDAAVPTLIGDWYVYHTIGEKPGEIGMKR